MLALVKPATGHATFFQVVRGMEVTLRRQLASLHTAHEQPTDVQTEPAEPARPTITLKFTTELMDEAVGQRFGRYKLLERVGKGGCAVAERTEPVRWHDGDRAETSALPALG